MTKPDKAETPAVTKPKSAADPAPAPAADGKAVEVGGRKGPEPTRYGDWEKKGIAVDF